jgi:hypothetical protein
MAFAMLMHYPGATVQQYDAAIEACNLDADPPLGQILHLVVETSEGVESWDVWQTEETARAFLDRRLGPALTEAGVSEMPEPRVFPLHNLFAPDMDTLGRIGAFSLPSRASASTY